MSRKFHLRKPRLRGDFLNNNLLIELLISQILKRGKKKLAQKIIYQALRFVALETQLNPIFVFESAIQNIRPGVMLFLVQENGINRRIPIEIEVYRSVQIAIKWLYIFANSRPQKLASERLAHEILDAFNNEGAAFRKKEETHKLVEQCILNPFDFIEEANDSKLERFEKKRARRNKYDNVDDSDE